MIMSRLVASTLLLGSLTLLGTAAGALPSPPGETEERSSTPLRGPVRAVDVELEGGSVVIRQGSKPAVDVVTSSSGTAEPEVRVVHEDGLLDIEAECDYPLQSPIVVVNGYNACRIDLVITVASRAVATTVDAQGDVSVTGLRGRHDLRSGTGDLTVVGTSGTHLLATTSGRLTTRDVSGDTVGLTTSTGDLVVDRATATRSFGVRTSSGDVRAAGVRAASLSIVTSTGDVALTGSSIVGSSVLESSSGAVSVTDVRSGLLDVQTSTADIALQRVVTAQPLPVRTSSGRVTVTAVNAPALSVVTSTGDVTVRDGALRDTSVETSSGDVSVRGAVLQRLRLTASTGDLDVDLPVAPTELVGSTSSGNVIAVVPRGSYRLELSGDVVARDGVLADDTAPRRIALSSNSGDVSVRGR